MTTIPNKNYLKEKRFIWAHSFREFQSKAESEAYGGDFSHQSRTFSHLLCQPVFTS